MRKSNACLILFSVILFLLPLTLFAQDGPPPPPCCPRDPHSIGRVGSGMPSLQGQLVFSDEMLQLQGITRSQFIDRLSENLFPNKAVDLILLSKQVATTQPNLVQASGLTARSLIAVQETLFYRTPRYAITAEQLEKLNQLGLTDGTMYVMVKFAGSISGDGD